MATRTLSTIATGTAAAAALALCVPSLLASGRPPHVDRATHAAQTPKPPRTDNLVAIEMGGRHEGGRETGVAAGFLAENALDGDPLTMYAAPTGTQTVLSFIGRDSVLVSDVTITFATPPAKAPYGWPDDFSLSWPKDVEIWLSTKSPTDGFAKTVAAPLPREPGDHVVKLPAPAEARFVRIVFPHNNGGRYGTLIAEFAVHEGRRAGYVPLVQRHPDLQTLLSRGKLAADPASLAYQAP